MDRRTAEVSVVAVVVAYNRRDLVVESVRAILHQSLMPTEVIVIDNASTDDTVAAVSSAAPGVTIIELSSNTGGAGGFAAGIAAALERDPEWVWVMDDDTVPTRSALAELVRAAGAAPADTDMLGSRVVWVDGTDHPMNTPRANPFARRGRRADATARGTIDVRSSSFVSMMIRASAVRRVGLPIAAYFLWNDDFEYSARLVRGRRGVMVPASIVVHKTRLKGSTDIDPGPRFFYEVRNKLWLMRYSRALSPVEKIVYSAATARRWATTFIRSSDRRTLRRGLRDGLREGLRRRPASNSEILAGHGPLSAAVAGLEPAR